MTPIGEKLLGHSLVVRALGQEIELAGRSDAKVLITGESGVGKDVVAGLIHQQSTRWRGPFLAINCAGVPDSLLESELFGHVRGSFTDAIRDKPGLLESADGGTVLLDEVGEMSPRMQALLLRFVETGEIQRVGAETLQRRVKVRIIAATNRSLLDRIQTNEFRHDLYYRLAVLQLVVPPLRDRKEDIPEFLDHFLRVFSTHYGVVPPILSSDALNRLSAYQWPGNVRELRNFAERLVVRCSARDGVVTPELFPSEWQTAVHTPGTPVAGITATHAEHVKGLIERMTKARESFWSVVYEPFMARDLTRADIRVIVRNGLERCSGSYKSLVPLFGMPATDYRRFLAFLRKYNCHVPLPTVRPIRAGLAEPFESPRRTVA